MTAAEFNRLKLRRSVAAQLATAETLPGGWLEQAALPFATLGALRRRGLVSPAARVPCPQAASGTRMASHVTVLGRAAQLVLAKLEEAWPGTLGRWADDGKVARL